MQKAWGYSLLVHIPKNFLYCSFLYEGYFDVAHCARNSIFLDIPQFLRDILRILLYKLYYIHMI
jgi:hypothetical protein